MVNVKVPEDVGVPVNVPLEAVKFSPPGNEPEAIDQV